MNYGLEDLLQSSIFKNNDENLGKYDENDDEGTLLGYDKNSK
jgi:hypothetical protein